MQRHEYLLSASFNKKLVKEVVKNCEKLHVTIFLGPKATFSFLRLTRGGGGFCQKKSSDFYMLKKISCLEKKWCYKLDLSEINN